MENVILITGYEFDGGHNVLNPETMTANMILFFDETVKGEQDEKAVVKALAEAVLVGALKEKVSPVTQIKENLNTLRIGESSVIDFVFKNESKTGRFDEISGYYVDIYDNLTFTVIERLLVTQDGIVNTENK
ncbi:MAG: hypothetical protein ACRC92_20520 [Peptostreptococcaceae bacterium]